MAKIRNYWAGRTKILYNVDLSYIFNENLTYKSGFKDIGIMYTVVDSSSNDITNIPIIQTLTISKVTTGCCSDPEQFIKNLQPEPSAIGYYIILGNNSFTPEIIYYNGETANIIRDLKPKDVIKMREELFQYIGGNTFTPLSKISIVQKDIPDEYDDIAPTEMGDVKIIEGSASYSGTYYRYKDLAWDSRPEPEKHSSKSDYRLLYYSFPHKDIDVNQINTRLSELEKKKLLTDEESKEYQELIAKLNDFQSNGNRYYYYRYEVKDPKAIYDDHKGEWWLTNPDKRLDTPSKDGEDEYGSSVDFCGTTGIFKGKFNPFLVVINSQFSPLKYFVCTYVKNTYGRITIYDNVTVSTFNKTYLDFVWYFDESLKNLKNYEQYKQNVDSVMEILNGFVDPLDNNQSITFYYEKGAFRFDKYNSELSIRLNEGLLGYGRKGLIMTLICRALMNRNYNGSDIVDFMEFATNIKGARWKKSELEENFIYPVMSSRTYDYDRVIYLYKVAAAIQTSLGQKPEEEDNYEYVDLGLSSGTLWAGYNIGTKLPTGYGEYFAWGEMFTKNYFDNSTYEVSDDYEEDATLKNDDDVANKKWGSSWKIPTKEQFEELIDECDWSWDGYGYKIISTTNGRQIYLPKIDGKIGNENTSDYSYWTSTKGDDNNKAYAINLNDRSVGQEFRTVGLNIRPVKNVNQ